MVLPDSILGYDTDDIFGYQSTKMTYIRDRWLGIFFYLLLTVVIAWVMFGQILWRNEHFQLKDVNGVARLWFSHPTVGMCDPDEWDCISDFTPMEQLPYCTQGSAPGGAKSRNAARCSYEDKFSMLQNPGINDQSFIPTSSVTFQEHLNCEPSNPDCRDVYKREATGYYYDPSVITYYADIERFRLQMTSSYERDGISGTSLEHQGHVEECEVERPPSQQRGWAERVVKRRDGCSKRGGAKRSIIECGEGMKCNLQTEKMPDLLEGVGAAGESLDNSVSFQRLGAEQEVQAAKYQSKMSRGSPSTRPIEKKSSQRMLNSRLAPRRHEKEVNLLATSEQLRQRAATAAGVVRVDAATASKEAAHASRAASSEEGSGRRLADRTAAGAKVESKIRGTMKSAYTQAQKRVPSDKEYYMTPWGDQFLLGKLLEVAGVQLDHDYNGDGLTVRQSGTIIEIEAEYNNMYRFASTFGYQPVEYTYHVHELAVPYMSREYYATVQPADYPRSRNIVLDHGVLVVFKVSGTFGFFNIVYLLIMLSVSAALLGSATRLTDLFMVYAHPKRRNYFHLKYELSPDFSDMWQCPQCKFWNEKHETVCKGLEKWESSKDMPVCNAPKPGAWQCDKCELYNDKTETECQHFDHLEHKCRTSAPADYEHRVRPRSTSETSSGLGAEGHRPARPRRP